MTVYLINIKVIITHLQILYVNRQRQLLSTPSQPMLSFNIVPYGTISGMQRIFAIDLIQTKEQLQRISLIIDQEITHNEEQIQINQNVIKVKVNTLLS